VSISPDSIQIGQCYLTAKGLILRVVEITPDGRAIYEIRRGPVREGHPWPRRASTPLHFLRSRIERPVPCDWTPESDEAPHSQIRG
jgi:hypothetical protein